MKRASIFITVLLSLFSLSLAVAQENDAIKDITKEMQKHALPRKLEVVKAVDDITAIAADGPKLTKLDVKPLVPGWYLFVFSNVDNTGFAYETRTIRLDVRDNVDATETNLAPEGETWDILRFGASAAKTNTVVHLSWPTNLGRGGPSGWQLTSITHSEKKPTTKPN